MKSSSNSGLLTISDTLDSLRAEGMFFGKLTNIKSLCFSSTRMLSAIANATAAAQLGDSKDSQN